MAEVKGIVDAIPPTSEIVKTLSESRNEDEKSQCSSDEKVMNEKTAPSIDFEVIPVESSDIVTEDGKAPRIHVKVRSASC